MNIRSYRKCTHNLRSGCVVDLHTYNVDDMWTHNVSTFWMWTYCGAMWIPTFHMWIKAEILCIAIMQIHVHSWINVNLIWFATVKMWIHHISICQLFTIWSFHIYKFDILTETLSPINVSSSVLKLFWSFHIFTIKILTPPPDIKMTYLILIILILNKW